MTTSTTRGRFVALAAVAALLLLFPATVAAHAELLESVPAADATVAGTPDELSATFSEPLLVDGSTFSIRNAAGERLAVGRVDPADPTRLIIETVPELAPGTYEMRAQAATADGHIERFTWTFTVEAPAATSASPTPTASASRPGSAAPSASAAATAPPTPAVSASPSGPVTPPQDPAASTGDVVLPIIAGLAIVLIAAGYLLSRRNRPSGPA